MKTTEEYLDDYFDKQNELSRKGEQWRIRLTPVEFIKEIERIRANGIESRKSNYLTEYHIQKNEEGAVIMLLMEKATLEEAKEQFERHRKAREEQFAKDAPEIQQLLKLIQTPLSFNDSANIYKWLWRKQITIEMISERVLEEFKKTEHYEKIIKEMKNTIGTITLNEYWKKIRAIEEPEIKHSKEMRKQKMSLKEFKEQVERTQRLGRERVATGNAFKTLLYVAFLVLFISLIYYRLTH